MVQRAGILPPRSSMEAVSEAEIAEIVRQSPLYGKYEREQDRRSAYEMLAEAREQEQKQAAEEARQAAAEKEAAQKAKEAAARKSSSARKTTGRRRQSALQKTVNSAATTVGREIGKRIVRGLFGIKL